MSSIIINHTRTGTQAFLPATYDIGSIIHTDQNVENPTPVEDTKDFDNGPHDYVRWGVDNMLPTRARLKSEQNGVFAQNRYIQACMLYGQGLDYYRKVDGQLEPIKVDEIEDFLEATDMNNFLLEQFMSFYTHFQTFLEVLMNKQSSTNSTDKIKALAHLEPEWSRISKRKNGRSKWLYYSPEFARSGRYDDKNGTKLIMAGRITRKELLKLMGKRRKFAVSLSFPSPGRSFYGCPPWGQLYEDDSWLDVSNETPKLIRALHKNLVNLKYVVHIPMYYWEHQYPEWGSYKDAKRKQLIEAKSKELNEFLAGPKNQHKSMIGHYSFDPTTGHKYEGFKIEPIQDYTKHDAYLPNSLASNAEICYAQGINPSVRGLQTPGGKLGAGSGSDIRVATNRDMALLKPAEDLLLKPVLMAHRWNGWDRDIVWKFKRSYITTLDDELSGVKTDQHAE